MTFTLGAELAAADEPFRLLKLAGAAKRALVPDGTRNNQHVEFGLDACIFIYTSIKLRIFRDFDRTHVRHRGAPEAVFDL